MSAVPAGLSTARAPPMTLPLGHFLVGLAFLAAAPIVAGHAGLAGGPGGERAALHLLLAGWVGLTIMGAMTQFVPVWSGTAIHSRRLAVRQLWLVAAGVPAIAAGMATGRYGLLALGGLAAAAGFGVFSYNLARTLAGVRPFDVTERHFAWTLVFLLSAVTAGLTLALTSAGWLSLPVAPASLRAAHGTLAVYGVVMTTVFGALYQLVTMFTRTELGRLERHLRTVETHGYPVGVLALAAGRLTGRPAVAAVGGVLVLVSVACVGVVLAGRLLASRVRLTPMLRRYAIVAVALLAWVGVAGPALVRTPTEPAAVFGPPGADRLLWLGVVALVVMGTLYHVVPFIVWVDRYSDRVGHEPVPMVDDLYVARVANVDLLAVTGAIVLLVVAVPLGTPAVAAAGVGLAAAGVALFVGNMATVFVRHGPPPTSFIASLRPV